MSEVSLDKTKYYLDATPFYYCHSSALEHCRRNLDVKVIFLTRDPIQRLKSSYRFFGEMYQEYPSYNFQHFVSALLDGEGSNDYKKSIPKPFFSELFSLELEMGNYAKHINKWESSLGKKRTLVVSLEDMENSPLDFMKRISKFLEIDDEHYHSYQFSAYMKSHGVRSKWLQKWLRRIGAEDVMRYDRLDEYQTSFHFINNSFIRRHLGGVVNRIQHRKNPDELDESTVETVNHFYSASNAIMRKKYGIDYKA